MHFCLSIDHGDYSLSFFWFSAIKLAEIEDFSWVASEKRVKNAQSYQKKRI